LELDGDLSHWGRKTWKNGWGSQSECDFLTVADADGPRRRGAQAHLIAFKRSDSFQSASVQLCSNFASHPWRHRSVPQPQPSTYVAYLTAALLNNFANWI
jgi:hypothetical protein